MAEIPDGLRNMAACASNDGCPHEAVALEKAAREIERLQGIVDKLPKCWGLKDGKLVLDVPVVPGMKVWEPDGEGGFQPFTCEGVFAYGAVGKQHTPYDDVYSTRAAAEAAKKETDND